MAEREDNVWQGSGPAPPSFARKDLRGWLLASIALGALAGVMALALLWGPWPGVSAPPWSLASQWRCMGLSLLRLAAPDLWPFEARMCATAWAGLGLTAKLGFLLRFALAGLAACGPGFALWPSFMRPRDRMIVLRGPTRHGPKASISALRSKLAARAKAEPDADIAPGLAYPSTKWCEHILVVGGTGAGKSTAIRPILRQAIEAGDQALIFDPKGDFTEEFAGPILLAPWDERGHAWDIGRDLRNLADMRRFAESIVESGGNDPMWANAARMVLVGMLSHLRVRHGEDWGFQELADLIAAPPKTIARVMEGASPEAFRLVERPTPTSNSILTTLSAAAAPIFDLALAWGAHGPERRVSMVDWAMGRGPCRQIILQGHKSYGPLARAFARPCIEIVASLVSSAEMPEDRLGRKWVVCDEFPALGKCDFRLLVEQGRSRGYRVVLAFQDIAQVEEVHGERLARALTSMVGTMIIGRLSPGETAEKMAKSLGSRESERPNVSTQSGGGKGQGGSSLSFAREQSQLYLASELGSRLGRSAGGKSVTLILATEGDCYEIAWPIRPTIAARPRLVPAAWTNGVFRRPRGADEPRIADGVALDGLDEDGPDP